MTEKPTSISAGELFANRDEWAEREDAGKCTLYYNGNRLDGIDQSSLHKHLYIIDAGGIADEIEYVDADTLIEIDWHDAPPADPVAAKRRLPLTVDDYKRDVAEIVKNHNLDHSQPYDAIEKLLQYIDVLEYQQMRYERSIEHHATENERLAEALKQIHTISLELTVQSRLSAAEPGSRIGAIAAKALGWLKGDEVQP